MTQENLVLIAPKVKMNGFSEAEVFGLVVNLWMQTPHHQNMPLHALTDWLLPALKLGQYLLALEKTEKGLRPIGYMSWANFNSELESQYVADATLRLLNSHWNSGDRPWIIDFVCPFGNTMRFTKAACRYLEGFFFRYLYHRGDEKGLRVMYFYGSKVESVEVKKWWKENPILAYRSQ
jgi:cytolysin-activating lysine-acyltransferase